MIFNEHKLGDYIDSITDTSKVKKDKLILINTSDVENGYVLNHSYVDNNNLKGQFKKRFKKGDILYSEIRPKNRRFAFIDFEADDYVASTKLMVLRNKGNIDNNFLYQILKSDYVIDYLQKQAESRSGTFPQITFDVLKETIVFIPDIIVQKKISSILNNIDNKIKLNNQINNNLHDLINSIYTETFSSFDVYKKAEDMANITIGKTPPRTNKEYFSFNENDINWVSISDLGKCGTYIYESNEKLTKEAVDKYNVKIVPSDTILLSFKLTVGRIAITYGEMATNEAIAHFNLKNNEFKYFLYSYLKNFDYSKLGSTSSIATAVNSKIIKSMLIGIPSDDLINDYNTKVKKLFDKIKSNENENKILEQLRNTLLPKLMNGEINLDNVTI